MFTVLLISNREDDAAFFSAVLGSEFSVQRVSSSDVAFAFLENIRAYAVLQDYQQAKAEDFRFLQQFAKDVDHASIPLICYLRQCLESFDTSFMTLGCADFLLPPFDGPLIRRRLHNAVRSKESFTFSEIESILRELPSNICLKDAEGKYIFATHYWHHIKGRDSARWTIRGKTDLEVRKNKANAQKAMETDAEILKTGKGMSYIIKETAAGHTEYLELIKRPTHDRNGKINGIVSLINNVTEKELLKMELERRSTVDAMTGLLNKSATEDLIEVTLD
ncbi:MAG: PAS domain-containing protein, partial [Desulfovibrio sp.]|nr:PAS domain-containing protein [Desulfovibrio sp.]